VFITKIGGDLSAIAEGGIEGTIDVVSGQGKVVITFCASHSSGKDPSVSQNGDGADYVEPVSEICGDLPVASEALVEGAIRLVSSEGEV
jgi:hypothetical protein